MGSADDGHVVLPLWLHAYVQDLQINFWGKTPVQHQVRSQLGIERGRVRSTTGGATIALRARLLHGDTHVCLRVS